MGAAASIVTAESLPESLRPLHEVCERLKSRIAEADAALIEAECKKMFKGHAQIIDELTARSKPQIKRMFDTQPSTLKAMDALVEGGNQYAQFIKMLASPKVDLEIEAVKACTGDTVDEDLLVEILGTSTTDEVRLFDEAFIREKTFSVNDYFASKCKEDSQLRKFVDRIMRLDRDESKDVDEELAEKQVDILHKAGASRLIGVEEEPIFEILSCASRSQCALLNTVYQRKYHMKLERAINIKFKGSCGKLMVLWTQPVHAAVLQNIIYLSQRMIVDKVAVARLVAKYDKDFWTQAEQACMKIHQKSIAELVGKAVSGTTLRALKGWMTSPSPDKGYERILSLYLDSKLGPNKQTLAELLEEADAVMKFQFLLEKQAHELKLFMVAHKLKLDPQDQAVLVRAGSSSVGHLFRSSPSGARLIASSTPAPSRTFSSSEIATTLDDPDVTPVEDEEDSEREKDKGSGSGSGKHEKKSSGGSSPHISPSSSGHNLRKKASKKALTSGPTHEELASKVYDYLIAQMERKDPEGEGSFAEEDFWAHLKTLPLRALGMTEKDLDAIRNWSEWEMDGRIFYYETLFEFSESVIAAIENKEEGDTDVLAVLRKLNESSSGDEPPSQPISAANSSSALLVSPSVNASNRKTVVALPDFGAVSDKRLMAANQQFPRIPLYVRQYIMDTAAAFDLNCNGFITEDEAETMVQAINVPTLTAQAIMGTKGKVEPKEVCDAVCKEIHAWFGDGQEHYLCLVDKSSGAYFWFNTLDESTQWADTQPSYEETAPVASDLNEGAKAEDKGSMKENVQTEEKGFEEHKSPRRVRIEDAKADENGENIDGSGPEAGRPLRKSMTETDITALRRESSDISKKSMEFSKSSAHLLSPPDE